MVEKKAKDTKSRRPKHPAINFKDALEKVRILYGKDGTAGSTREAALKHFGYKGAHGASLTTLSALEKYGLTIEENKRIMITKDALQILLKGGSEGQKKEILKRCALKPELYKYLWDQFAPSGSLPSNDTLKSQLIIDLGFSSKAVDEIVRNFRETIDFAQLDIKKASADLFLDRGTDLMQTSIPTTDTNGERQVGEIRDYPIPRKERRIAVLRLEYPVTKEDLEQITKWLLLMEDTLSDAD